MGTFAGAVDPGIKSFGQFKDFAAHQLDPAKHRRIAMFCTGGIRCEKASAYLLARGFAEVYHLKGGILRYLEGVPEQESRWRGECFVFDDRVALGHGLRERQISDAPMSDVEALSERIDALEIRLTFQDETIETLNQTITAQWQQIDALTRQVAGLNERLQEAESSAPGRPTSRRRIIDGGKRKRPPRRRPLRQLQRINRMGHKALYPFMENQTAAATTTITIAAHTTGVTFLVLPLRGESLAAWLNSVFIIRSAD